MEKVYTNKSVLDAAKERIAYVFDEFENIHISISSGKDSTAMFFLVADEATRRNRKITAFFLDQEAEYQGSIDLIEKLMAHPAVIPAWYQVEIAMTNSTSYSQDMLNAWGIGEKWMRAKHPMAIHEIREKYPKRFYDFFKWYEKTHENAAVFVGLRAEESLNRFRAVTKNAAYKGVSWSTKTTKVDVIRFYPIYDWSMTDVWKYIKENNLPYNSIYDKMFAANKHYYNTMRVSNLVHEKSFSCLTDLQELEPETFERIIKRIEAAHCAAIYAKEKSIYSVEQRPAAFTSWLEYREYLLKTLPTTEEKKQRFINRFEGQLKTEDVYKQQCKQLLLNDWENNLPVNQKRREKTIEKYRKWYEIL